MKLQTERLRTADQIRGFLDRNGEVDFAPLERDGAYEFARRTLVRVCYAALSRSGKGTVREYLGKMTGLSRAQGAAPHRPTPGNGADRGSAQGQQRPALRAGVHADRHPAAGGGLRGAATGVRGVRRPAVQAPVTAVGLASVQHAAVEDLPRQAHGPGSQDRSQVSGPGVAVRALRTQAPSASTGRPFEDYLRARVAAHRDSPAGACGGRSRNSATPGLHGGDRLPALGAPACPGRLRTALRDAAQFKVAIDDEPGRIRTVWLCSPGSWRTAAGCGAGSAPGRTCRPYCVATSPRSRPSAASRSRSSTTA